MGNELPACISWWLQLLLMFISWNEKKTVLTCLLATLLIWINWSFRGLGRVNPSPKPSSWSETVTEKFCAVVFSIKACAREKDSSGDERRTQPKWREKRLLMARSNTEKMFENKVFFLHLQVQRANDRLFCFLQQKNHLLNWPRLFVGSSVVARFSQVLNAKYFKSTSFVILKLLNRNNKLHQKNNAASLLTELQAISYTR